MQPWRLRQPVEPLDPRQIVAAIEMRRRDMPQSTASASRSRRQFRFERVEILARPGDEGDALGMQRDFGQAEVAFALVGAHLAQADSIRDSRP